MVLRKGRNKMLWINDVIKLPDGRVGTVVYHGLDGEGIKFGIHNVPLEDLEGTSGGLFRDDLPLNHPSWQWRAEAMLRDQKLQHLFDIECVGEEFEMVRHRDDINEEKEI